MKNVSPVFEVFEGGVEQLPSGFQEIKCHMIFDIKIGETFRRKACLVAGGHTTDALPPLLIRRSSHAILFGLRSPLRP